MASQKPRNEEGPPDLDQLITKLKEKIQTAFKAKKSLPPSDSDEQLSTPACSCESDRQNYIVDVIVSCSNCSNRLIKKTIKKPYKVAAILAVLSYGTSQFVEYVITDNRYPLDIEFETLSACVNPYERPILYNSYRNKKEICLCAMEDTMNEISYVRFSVDERGFLDAFEQNIIHCSK